MPVASFDTPDGEEVEIDSDQVVSLRLGPDPDTTLVELDDGDDLVVVGSQLEIAAELELNPLEFIDPEDDDESIEGLVEEDGPDEVDDES